MTTKADWKTVEMPERTAAFVLEKSYTESEMEAVREGHKPQEMEDKWFLYHEGEKLFIHRSWTGYCIYIVDFAEPGKLRVTVNRDPEQYRETDLERDKVQVLILLNRLAGRHGENAGLMKAYLARKQREAAR